MPLNSRRRIGQVGLTLIELLFAISVTAVTCLGIAGMFPAALRSVVAGGQVTKAVAMAQSMTEMIRTDPFDTLVSRYHGFDTRSLGATCPFSPSGYDVDAIKKKWTCDLLATQAQVTGRGLPDAYGTISVTCLNADGTTGTCGNTDLRRVAVTVTWGRAGARLVSLVTYVARIE